MVNRKKMVTLIIRKDEEAQMVLGRSRDRAATSFVALTAPHSKHARAHDSNQIRKR